MIVVAGRDGSRHEIDPAKGQALMLRLRPMKLGIVGLCNGNAACGTCHVYIGDEWADRLPEPDEYEEEMLQEVSHRTARSRLSCQIDYESALDGLELTIAPRG